MKIGLLSRTLKTRLRKKITQTYYFCPFKNIPVIREFQLFPKHEIYLRTQI